jgi:ribosomal protein S2
MERYIKLNANRSGEYFICDNWPKGLVSNFKEVQKSFRKFISQNSFNKSLRKSKFFKDNWLFTRFS